MDLKIESNHFSKAISSIEESKRINAIKLIATFGVLFLHSYIANVQYENMIEGSLYRLTAIFSNNVCDFVVPCFMLISSYLLFIKPRNWLQNIKSKFISLLIPLIIFNSIWIVLSVIKSKYLGGPSDYYSFTLIDWIDAYVGLFPDYKPNFSVLWYIRDLFILNLLAPIIKKIVDLMPEVVVIIASIVWFSGISTPFIHTYAWVFFLYGCYIVKNKNKILTILKRKNVRTCIYVLFFLLLICDALFSFVFIHRLYIYAAILALAFLSKRIIMYEGKYHFLIPCLFFIYLCHKIIYMIVNSFLWNGGIKMYFLLYFLNPVLALVISVCIYYLLKKISPKLLGVLIGGRNV